jgi:hypothetical protein
MAASVRRRMVLCTDKDGENMRTRCTTRATRPGRHALRKRDVPVAITVAALAMIAGCSSGTTTPQASSTPGNPASPTGSLASSSSGNISSGNTGGAQGNEGTGSFTLAFARCMRTHGVPNFPDPDGHNGQLGPDSGIDPNSPPFQSAINGPCVSLAPPGWVGSGKVTR